MTADTITAIKKALDVDMNQGVTAVDRLRLLSGGQPDFDPLTAEDAEWIENSLKLALSALESLQRENERFRQFLFPYADNTEISGISWDGKYLIGDKASISAFREMQNRGLQINVYKRAYDENVASFKARISGLIETLQEVRSEFRVEYEGEKIVGMSHSSESLPRIINVLDAALSSTGDTHGN